MEFISKNPEDTFAFAKQIASYMQKGMVIAFFGNLGAGKTFFIKGICRALEKDPIIVTSPTFTYLNIYEAIFPVYHFDLYRLENAEQFLKMGFDEYLQSDGICLIEWAEKIENLLPSDVIKIKLEHVAEDERKISCLGLMY